MTRRPSKPRSAGPVAFRGSLELTATFRDRATGDEPMRIVMPMRDGDSLYFGMPDYRGPLHSFSRTGREISISAEIKPQLAAAK